MIQEKNKKLFSFNLFGNKANNTGTDEDGPTDPWIIKT